MELLIFELKTAISYDLTFYWSLILCVFEFFIKTTTKCFYVSIGKIPDTLVQYKKQTLASSPSSLLQHTSFPLTYPTSSTLWVKLWFNLFILNCLIFLSKPSFFLCLCSKYLLCLERHTSTCRSGSWSHPKLSSWGTLILKPFLSRSLPQFLPLLLSFIPQFPLQQNSPMLIMHPYLNVFQGFTPKH